MAKSNMVPNRGRGRRPGSRNAGCLIAIMLLPISLILGLFFKPK